MKKLMLPLLAVLFFAACQNSTTPATNDASDSQTPAIKIDPVQVKEANVKAKSALETTKNFLVEVNATSTSLKGTQKESAQRIADQLNDIIAKQETIQKGLEITETGSINGQPAGDAAVPTPGVVDDYIKSVGNYDKTIEELKAQLEELKAGKPKQ